jgi:O-acetyl-ADP-ribose deacetylase (regulator of RNase III)
MMMLPDKIILAAISASLADAWSEVFSTHDQVEVYRGDFFSRNADAMVSPANSFGIMDGGLDAAIRAVLGGQVESRVQAAILERHHGELPVGLAEIVPTAHPRWPYLVVAPTMRVPENVASSVNGVPSRFTYRRPT